MNRGSIPTGKPHPLDTMPKAFATMPRGILTRAREHAELSSGGLTNRDGEWIAELLDELTRMGRWGMVLVPREPTEAMLDAAWPSAANANYPHELAPAYRAMLAAALPAVPEEILELRDALNYWLPDEADMHEQYPMKDGQHKKHWEQWHKHMNLWRASKPTIVHAKLAAAEAAHKTGEGKS